MTGLGLTRGPCCSRGLAGAQNGTQDPQGVTEALQDGTQEPQVATQDPQHGTQNPRYNNQDPSK